MSFWPVQPFDPVTASDGDLAALHVLDVALETEALPGEPVAPLAHSGLPFGAIQFRWSRPPDLEPVPDERCRNQSRGCASGCRRLGNRSRNFLEENAS